MSLLKKCLFYAIPFAFMLLVFEIVLRAMGFGPLPSANINLSSTGYFWVADKTLGFRNRVNGRYVNAAFERAPLVTTDENGYRNGFSSSKDASATIVFVGDSSTFCAEVNDNETGPSEVAKILALKGLNAKVVNAGVRGYNTVQTKRMLDEAIKRFPGAQVAVYVYSDNDLYENLNSIYAPVLSPTASWNKETAQVIEKEVDSESVPWGSAFSSVLPNPGTAMGKRILAASHSALAYNLQSAIHALSEQHSSGETAKGAPPPIASRAYALEYNGEQVLEGLIDQMRDICARAGVHFMVTQFTNGSKGEVDEWLGKMCLRNGVQFLPINDKFKGRPAQYEVRFAGNRVLEGHYNTLGTRTFAEGVAPGVYSAITAPMTTTRD